MSERDTRGDESAAAFRAGLPYFDRRLVTSDKWVAGFNAGGIYFGDITEIPMSMRESIANSRTGSWFIAIAKRVLSSRA